MWNWSGNFNWMIIDGTGIEKKKTELKKRNWNWIKRIGVGIITDWMELTPALNDSVFISSITVMFQHLDLLTETHNSTLIFKMGR